MAEFFAEVSNFLFRLAVDAIISCHAQFLFAQTLLCNFANLVWLLRGQGVRDRGTALSGNDK